MAKGRLARPWGEQTARSDADPVGALDITLTDDEAAELEEPYTPRDATGY